MRDRSFKRRNGGSERLFLVCALAAGMLLLPSAVWIGQQALATPGDDCDDENPCGTGEDCCDGECYDTSTYCCDNGTIGVKNDIDDPISGSIISDDGEEWAHVNDVSESCALSISGPTDLDIQDCSETDNYASADWDGDGINDEDSDGLDDNTGAPARGYCTPNHNSNQTKWFAYCTGGTTVTATLKDKTDTPSIDDDDLTVSFGNVNGFSVYAVLTASGEVTGSVQVAEGEDGKTISAGEDNVGILYAAHSPHFNPASDTTYVMLRTDFKTVPSHAVPRNNIIATVTYKPDVEFTWEVDDDDIFDADGDAVSVGGGIQLTPFSADVGYEWSLEDDYEGCVALSWTFATSSMGGNKPPSADWFFQSGDYAEAELPKTGAMHIWYDMQRSAQLCKQKGQSEESSYAISGGATGVGGGVHNVGRFTLGWMAESEFTLGGVSYGYIQ